MNYIKTLLSKSIYLIFIPVFLSINGCEPMVIFEQAMPPEVEPINSIPEEFQGIYRCESDGSRLFADANKVYRETYYQFSTSIEKIKETEDCSILAGGLYLPGRKECIPFEYLGEDSITAKIYDLETLFHFGPKHVAKKYKGRLFLNMSDDKDNWITFMISPNQDGSMLWELIDIPNKLKEVTAITPNFKSFKNTKDKTIFIIDPTMVEFERIISNESNIMECDILYPINIEDDYKVENWH